MRTNKFKYLFGAGLALAVLVLAVMQCGCESSNKVQGYDAKADRKDKMRFTMRDVAGLQVDHGIGQVTVKGDEIAQCFIDAKVTVHANNEAQARQVLRGTRVISERIGRDMVVRVERPEVPFRYEVVVDLDILTPQRVDLNVTGEQGKLHVRSLQGDIWAHLDQGGIDVEDVSGAVELKTGNGNVEVEETGGDIDIQVGNGDVEISDHRGGSVTCNADVTTGNIECKQVRGVINLRTRLGEIEMVSTHGRISSETDDGPIKIKDFSGELMARSQSGSVSADHIDGAPGRMDIWIETQTGDVDLELPERASAEVELISEYGAIESDLPALRIVGQMTGHHRGRIGAGAGRVYVKTSSGKIRVR